MDTKKMLSEFIGTFFLVLTIVLAVNGGAGIMAPVAIGSILMVMVYAGGHISGAHYNPAVTLAILMRGGIDTSGAIGYWIAQVVGGVLAALIGVYLLGSNAMLIDSMSVEVGPALFAEFLGTFALVYVILNVATAKANAGNSYFGLAIGFTVTACAYAFGGVSGGAFNPAVALGISTAGMAEWGNIWIFLVGNFAAGAAAAIVFKSMVKD